MNDMPPLESFMKPRETPVRLRQDLDSSDAFLAANAWLKAAECQTCAFRKADTCRAWPPRPLADGRPVWPKVEMTDWCGCWRAP